MIQKSVRFTGYDELNANISNLKSSFSGYTYGDGYIDLGVVRMPPEEISDCLNLLNSEFPKLKILGISSSGLEALYRNKESKKDDKEITLNFIFMERAKVKLFSFEFIANGDDFDKNLQDFLSETREEIIKTPDVKSIEIYFSRGKVDVDKFLRNFTEGIEDIPLYGAVSFLNSYNKAVKSYDDINDDSFVIAGDTFFPGIVIGAFYGQDLYAYVDYLFGWEPIGRHLEVNYCRASDTGNAVISSLDGDTPANIYKKYLGVPENDFFIWNICEFPLIVERDGLYMGRNPSAYGPEGEFYLEADILPGEKVRLSYGEYEKILNGTENGASRMRAFGAQALSLVICNNRLRFFQEDNLIEPKIYAVGRDEEPPLILGMGEIYRYKGKGGVLNSAIVAAGMREGLGDEKSSILDSVSVSYTHPDIIPLSERLSHFLKAMTDELADAVHDAKAANEAKSTFLSNMSHEIRTPINAVLGMDEMILREAEDEQILEYAQNIKTAGTTLLGLINDILDFSKIEAGRMDIVPVDYDLSSVLNDLITMIRQRGDAKGLQMIFEIDPGLPSVLYGDEIRIKQVITNILTNAVKYTEQGSVTLKISYEQAGKYEIDFKVSVKDTGIGIKETDLKRMYNAFQRVDEVRNRNVEGTGLGLNITRQLLKLMGSELKVESVYGEGSEFSFSVRQRIVRRDPIGDYMEAYHRSLENREKYQEKFTAPKAEVLVVDDTPMNITVFRNLLKKTGVQIESAGSGPECLEKTRQRKYDIIFLDHRMPDMDGIETLNILKSEKDNPNLHTFVVSLTANAVSGAREQYIEAGFDDYLTKPINADKLEMMLLQYLPEDKVERLSPGEAAALEEKNKPDFSLIPEWIRSAAELNLEAGVDNCGSVDGYIESVKSFAEDAEDTYNDIKNFYEGDDLNNYTIKVHALKSSARIIGAAELSLLAEAMEKAGEKRDISQIKKHTPRLLEMFKRMSDGFDEGRQSEEDNSDNELPEMEAEQFKEAENALKEVAGNFDYDSVQYIMETINKYRVPLKERKKIRDLKKAIFKADWEKIRKLLGIND